MIQRESFTTVAKVVGETSPTLHQFPTAEGSVDCLQYEKSFQFHYRIIWHTQETTPFAWPCGFMLTAGRTLKGWLMSQNIQWQAVASQSTFTHFSSQPWSVSLLLSSAHMDLQRTLSLKWNCVRDVWLYLLKSNLTDKESQHNSCSQPTLNTFEAKHWISH